MIKDECYHTTNQNGITAKSRLWKIELFYTKTYFLRHALKFIHPMYAKKGAWENFYLAVTTILPEGADLTIEFLIENNPDDRESILKYGKDFIVGCLVGKKFNDKTNVPSAINPKDALVP